MAARYDLDNRGGLSKYHISIVAFAAIFAMAFLRLEAVFPPSAFLPLNFQ